MMSSKHRILKTVGGVVLLALVAGTIYADRMKARLANYLRERAITTLEQRFDGKVEFHDLHISLFPHIVFRGDGLTLRHHDRPDVPPLIHIKTFWTEVGIADLLRPTHHVGKITLEGLTIVVPPHEERPANPPPSHVKAKPFKVVVDEIVANGTELDILLKDPGKPPRVFQISRLTLHGAGMGQAMSYQATLSNPIPAGEIQSHGEFGPWQVEDPSSTPLLGDYTFSHADLSTIHGLGGILSSKGKFSGLLERIDVYGETDTPDFNLGISGNPVPLHTRFHAIVDGTNGNTMLDDVHATLANSKIDAHGGVFRVPGERYREVLLDAGSKNAQLADMLRLALKAQAPPMTGVISFQTRIDIPPEGGLVADKLKLDGKFNIASAHFSQLNIQKKVAELSRRGRGETGETEGGEQGSVASNFAGEFSLRDAVMKLSNLTFEVPGAAVNLDGTFALHGEALDFAGALKLQAKVSQLVTGWKSVLLRPFDPLFEKEGAGTLVPITVTGTGSDPQFGLDFHHLFFHSHDKSRGVPESGSVASRGKASP